MSALDKQVGVESVEGYKGLYAVSSEGIVYSLGEKSNHKNIIQLSLTVGQDGYLKCVLQKNKNRKTFRVSRLVANTFILNPKNFPIVNHIDGNILNNRRENLEWTDNYGNWKHSHNPLNNEIPVVKKDMRGRTLCEYKSLMDAARDTRINQGNITNCLKGRCKSVGGFKWEARKVH